MVEQQFSDMVAASLAEELDGSIPPPIMQDIRRLKPRQRRCSPLTLLRQDLEEYTTDQIWDLIEKKTSKVIPKEVIHAFREYTEKTHLNFQDIINDLDDFSETMPGSFIIDLLYIKFSEWSDRDSNHFIAVLKTILAEKPIQTPRLDMDGSAAAAEHRRVRPLLPVKDTPFSSGYHPMARRDFESMSNENIWELCERKLSTIFGELVVPKLKEWLQNTHVCFCTQIYV